MFEAAWRKPGFCVPNPMTYPHQWLWDSCFHAIVWAALGDSRAVTELSNVVAHQDASSGFVPHMTYWTEPDAGAEYWGRTMTSCITQPPMYGHAAAFLLRRGFDVPDDVLARCERGLAHLLRDRPRTPAGLVPVFHPWETGCDDSARWADWATVAADGPTAWRNDGRESWRSDKNLMVQALTFGPGPAGHADGNHTRAPLGSTRFAVGSVGFNALVAWNVQELLSVGRAADLRSEAAQLVEAIGRRWSDNLATWVDDPVTTTEWWMARHAEGLRPTAGRPGHERPVLDAMLGCLVDPRPDALQALTDPAAFGAPYGPAGARADEVSLDLDTYWRGPAWPQLSYLAWQAVEQHTGRNSPAARTLGRQLADGARQSQLAEFWNPVTGAGRGAQPQTWAGLGILPLDS